MWFSPCRMNTTVWLTWYMAYLGTMLRPRRWLLVFMKVMATGQRETIVRTPMNGLIQIAVPVISSWKRSKEIFKHEAMLISLFYYNQIVRRCFKHLHQRDQSSHLSIILCKGRRAPSLGLHTVERPASARIAFAWMIPIKERSPLDVYTINV